MEYVCEKPISFSGTQYRPGDIIPDGIVFDSRAAKLKRSGYITDIETTSGKFETPQMHEGIETLYTQEELDAAVESAVNKTTAEMEQKQAEFQELSPEAFVEAFEGAFIVPVKTEDDESENAQYISLPITPEGIVQVVSIMQSKANEGIEAISGITDENVLILIHALDNRVTVKNAAKKQAGTLTNTEIEKNDARDSTESTEPSAAETDNKTEDGVMPQGGGGK